MSLYSMVRPVVFRLDPERAHNLALAGLRWSGQWGRGPVDPPRVGSREVLGLRFANPVGLAAGLDKDGCCVDGLGRLGFGFLEVGTVTPRPQDGNPRPRMFRLPGAGAVINRMGFNNLGAAALAEAVRGRRYRGVLGINLGKNAKTPLEEAAEDYRAGMDAVYGVADYLTVNISSPNTQGLRRLQEKDSLARLLDSVVTGRDRLAGEQGRRVPLCVKVAPDLEGEAIPEMIGAFVDAGIDGVIATNTTLARRAVAGLPHAEEAGGLSGRPLRSRSREVVRAFAEGLPPTIPVIGAGGIGNAADVRASLAAGAQLVQLYTALVYEGPGLIARILGDLEGDLEPVDAGA